MHKLATFSLFLSVGLAVPPAFAQSIDGPAELPPATFEGSQYVDSQGCGFVRVTVNGATSWIARVDQDRNPLCNFEPTFAWTVTDTVAEDDTTEVAEAVKEADTAEAASTPETAAEPVESALADEAETPVISTDLSEEVAEAPAPRPTAPAAPRRAPVVAPAPVVAETPAPIQTQPVTRDQACAGKSGIQPNLLSLSTGLPIDCGPATEIVDVPAVSDEIPRLTLAEVCQRTAETGVRYTNAETGEAVVCPEVDVQVATAAPTASVSKTYIQVGSFAVHSNADRLIARLGDLGLPVASGRSGRLKIVAAGPFMSASAQQQALATVRGLGFSDAFLRN